MVEPTLSAPAPAPRANLALYRKYRSATFADVIGQEHVTVPLSAALSAGRINHAYLFSGPRGCGKTSSARILARSLNCVQGPTSTPCGACDSCRELAPNGPGSIDVIEIDAASHGGVDDARDLRERAFYAPVRDRYKVYIIDEAHMVTTQGFNALLKLIEEPPDFLVFVFATTEPDKVLQTIRSRTHHYPFRLVPPGVLRAHLERICAAEGALVEPTVLPLIVRAGGGSVRDSLSLLDQLLAGSGPQGVTYQRAVGLLGVTDVALIDDMVDALAVGDAASVYGTVDRVVEAGHEPRRFAADLLDRLRDLLVLDAVPEAAEKGLLDVPADTLDRMGDQARRIGGASAARYAEIVHTALTEMRGTTAPRLVLELVCARMLLPDASVDSAAVLQRLERLERRLSAGDATTGRSTGGDPTVPAGAAPAVTRPAPGRLAADAPAEAERTRPEPLSSTVASSAPAIQSASVPQAASLPPSSPVEPGAPGLDVTALRTMWPQVLEQVKDRSKRTRALLEAVQISALHGSTVSLVQPAAPLARMLAQPQNTEVISAALTHLLSGTWNVVVGVEAGARADVAPPSGSVRATPAATSAATPAAAPTSAATPAAAPTSPAATPAATTSPAPAPATHDQGWPEVSVAPSGGPAGPSATTGPAVTPAPARGERTRRDRSPSAGEPPRTSTSTDEGVGDGAGEPEDYPDDEGSAPGRRHDPEADALALLETGLGARRVES